jgi:CDP-diacylglycerol---glycerol-3-phosphate 3-phosphatidyltransferase
MANLVTLSRFLLLFVLVVMAYRATPAWQLLDMPLLVLIIVLDAVDGYVARRRGESSVFGSIFDIAVDRVVENVLWIILADLDLIPVWVAITFITRSLVVDSIRCQGAAHGQSAFSMMRTPLGRFLVSGRFMRALYGTLKAITFGWIFMIQPWPSVFPTLWNHWAPILQAVSLTLVSASVTVCLLRGVPVVIEFALSEGMLVTPRPPRRAR